jgi:hypothetical protein
MASRNQERVRNLDQSESGETIIGRVSPSGSLVRGSEPRARGTAARPRAGEAPASVVSSARRKRRQWEGSAEGQQRTRDIRDIHDGTTTVAQYHFERNYDRPTSGARVYDQQLPGMSDPNAAPRPPLWDELSANQQKASERALAEYGTNIDQIASDLGAQYDQGVARSSFHGHDRAYAEDFYSSGEPRRVLDRSAADLGIPPTIHAQMNAMTSPNTKFQSNRGEKHPQAGETYYPNDEAARHAVRFVQQTGSAEGITNELAQTGEGDAASRAQGYTTNIRKAASAFEQYESGTVPAGWVTGAKGTGPFDNSPKTGPYANAWSDSQPQFFVSDVHSGGGGAFPHLSSSKPATGRLDDSGRPIRDKSEREKALERVPFAHTAIDEGARRAAAQRNLPSIREFQATQWGEEQIQRGLAHPQDVYRHPPRRTEDPNQGRLF